MGYQHWSERHGNPFPWLGIAIYSIPIALIVFALILGASRC
jgi:hypothetical protein